MMATHPSTPERIAQATAEAHAIGPPGIGARGRDAYLSAIDGLAFGDDPSQGIVRGTAFLHPKLGFAFQAPEGFTLENQTSALDRRRRGGRRSVAARQRANRQFDVDRGGDRVRLDRRRQDDLDRNDQIGGLEAATAVAKGDQWSFRLGGIRLNGRLYRLIFAAHTLTPAVDARIPRLDPSPFI